MGHNVYQVHIKPLYSATPNKYFPWTVLAALKVRLGSKMVKILQINLVTLKSVWGNSEYTCGLFCLKTPCHQKKEKIIIKEEGTE